ncbi:glycerol kinase GlpK [Lentilactobacillus sp. Marseille-Q4993]|uniref:glycerol kinase GlpK n=1 Tax=Lentilactobacillus sp. Marseille-Q4993 TaxID=3039492 RepID=UPI0024BC51D5|nr:glycerol kinase GlpK [Lentilactobacillus sp. Marseille-Q4993]
MNSQFILSIDIGTTRTTATIIDHDGNKVIHASKPISQFSFKPSWFEQDANEIWEQVMSAITGVLIMGKLKPEQIAGIGISNQRETTVIWDKKTGTPIHNALMWESRQTEEYTNRMISNGYSEMIHRKTGLRIDPYFSASKIMWLLDHVDGAREKAEKGKLLFGTMDTWLIWKLTRGKVHVTDYTNASRTMIFNIKELSWDEDLLDLLKIPANILPEVKSNSEVYDTTDKRTFFNTEVPICGIAGDQQAATIGQLATERGDVVGTYGTGAFIIMNTGNTLQLSNNNLITTICYGLNGEVNYALEGSIFVAGAALQWLKDGLKMVKSVADADILATQSTDNNNMYVVPAFTGLSAPYWDPNAQAASFGMTSKTTNADFIRATIDSIAYQTTDIIKLMQNESNIYINELRVNGEVTKSKYWREFLSNILDVQLLQSSAEDADARGVAFLAGLAVGYWDSFAEIKQLVKPGTSTYPSMSPDNREFLYEGWKNAVRATQEFKHIKK